MGLSFCKVSAGRNKNQLLPLGGVRVFRLIQAPPPPVACLRMGPFLLFFVTWSVSLVFRACNSSRSFIHLVMMGLCMPMKCQAVTVGFTQAPGLACSQIQGVWGWFWVNSSLPCYALLHLIALVCSDLNISGLDFGFSVTGQSIQNRASDSRNILVFGWLDLWDWIWEILAHSPFPLESSV